MSAPTDGRARVRAALARLPDSEPLLLTDLFGEELDQYAELIAGPGGAPLGFMTHGDGPRFTERVRSALAMLGMPEAARAHHAALAHAFEHTNGFFKAEWGAGSPLAAIYFRRRPELADALAGLAAWGVRDTARLARMAELLDKDTVHFLAAAFRPGQPVHHKLYFSQWAPPEARGDVAARIARVFELFGVAPDAWRAHHDAMVADGDPTLFVSTSVTAAGPSPSFKIDYPDVSFARAAAWCTASLADARLAAELAGTEALSYVGVRFAPGAAPALKCYADVPGGA